MAESLTSSEPLDRVTKQVVQQKKLILLVAALAVAVIAAISLYQTRRSDVQSTGGEALFEAKMKLRDELAKVTATNAPAPKKAEIDAKTGKPKSVSPAEAAPKMPEHFALATSLPTALPALKSVGEKFESSSAGYDANLILGQLYYERDSSADAAVQAAGYFKRAADQKLDSARTSVALSLYAYALEATGKKDEALAQVDAALGLAAKSGIEIDLLEHQARLLHEKGDTTKAVASVERLLKAYPNTEAGRWAEQRKAEWAPASAAPAAAPAGVKK